MVPEEQSGWLQEIEETLDKTETGFLKLQPVKGAAAKRFQERMMESGRSERHLSTEAAQGELAAISLAPVADAIREQRNGRRDFSVRPNTDAVHPSGHFPPDGFRFIKLILHQGLLKFTPAKNRRGIIASIE